MADLRVVFMGTADLSRVSLQALLGAPGLHLLAAVTQPDRPKGRDLKLQPTPVKELALRHHIPVLQPEKARSADFVEELRALAPDLIAVAAYGQILPKSILDLPRFGCLNVHTSLLPRYRGAGPIQWAILNGDAATGVTIMKMDVTLDTGDILAKDVTPIRAEDNAVTLHDRLALMGAELLVRVIPDYVAGKLVAHPQPLEGVTYAPKIAKPDGIIDWRQPARTVWNRVRGLVPWPGAFTHLPASPNPQMLKVWEAEIVPGSGAPGEVLQADKNGLIVACGQEALRILAVQREGGRRLRPHEFLAGHPISPGSRLGCQGG